MTKQVNRLINGALILTLAGVISKILSAMYRIPLQNLTGDLGFYTYQQIYPLIATVTILSLYGFPLAVSRIIAEQVRQDRTLSYRYDFLPILIILFIVNGTIALILWMSAPTLAHWMHDLYLIVPLRLSAGLFLLIPFLSLFRGVFQSELQMKQTAYSQMIEQLVRVTMIIVSAWFIFRGSIDVRSIAELGVISSLAGMAIAIVVLAVLFFRRHPFHIEGTIVNRSIQWRTYLKTVITFGMIAALNHLTLIFIQFIDVFTLVPQLIKAGVDPLFAMEQKGIFDRGIPLIQFGAVLGSSFALAFVPSITRQNVEEQKQSIRDAISVSIYVATGATIGLIVIYEEVNRLLFKDDIGTAVLQILALSIFLLSISITGNAILQAYGYIKWAVFSLVISLIVKTLLNYILTPIWGTYGSAVATVVSLSCLTIMTVGMMYRRIRLSLWKDLRFLPLVSAGGVMALYLWMITLFVPSASFSRLSLFIFVLFLVISGAFIYLIILLRYKALHRRHIKSLPMSERLLAIQKVIQK